MRKIFHTVLPEDSGNSVYFILRNRMNVSEAIIRHARKIDEGVFLDGMPSRTDAVVRSGQIVSLALFHNGRQTSIPPEEGPLSIIHEDEDLLILDKPTNLVVHPSRGHFSGTLCNYVAAHYLNAGNECNPHPVNRLDKDTSGIIVFAKHAHMQNLLQEQLHSFEFQRTYLAICEGVPEYESGTIRAPIARLRDEYGSFGVSEYGKHATTHYEIVSTVENPLAKDGTLSLLQLKLETGRTHQIRVHMSHIGYPLLGDNAYGSPSPLIQRCALHSWSVSLYNPITGQKLSFKVPLPNDMASLFPE